MKRAILTGIGLTLILATLAQAELAFDRGLPKANLNNAAGADRSNVDWAETDTGAFNGDDFILPFLPAGQLWRIDKIVTWSDAGRADDAAYNLVDNYVDITLYGGAAGSTLAALSNGDFLAGGGNSNANITSTRVNYPDGTDGYQAGNSGGLWQLWQHEFTNLNWVVAGGEKFLFGVNGTAQAVNGDYWFNEYSNKDKGGVTADGADGLFYSYNLLNLSSASLAGQQNPITLKIWDKGSDMNIQIYATAVPAPGAILLVVGGLSMVSWLKRRVA